MLLHELSERFVVIVEHNVYLKAALSNDQDIVFLVSDVFDFWFILSFFFGGDLGLRRLLLLRLDSLMLSSRPLLFGIRDLDVVKLLRTRIKRCFRARLIAELLTRRRLLTLPRQLLHLLIIAHGSVDLICLLIQLHLGRASSSVDRFRLSTRSVYLERLQAMVSRLLFIAQLKSLELSVPLGYLGPDIRADH